MYPGFISRWKSDRCREVRVGVGCGSRSEERYERGRRRRAWAYEVAGEDDASAFGFGGGSFGVRRPLRFLAYKLELDDAQVAELARVLDEIKTERAQAAVDHRRALAAFADAISGETFDREKAEAGAGLRLKSADRLRAAVVTALGRLHDLLGPDQRSRLAYLIRTGTLSIRFSSLRGGESRPEQATRRFYLRIDSLSYATVGSEKPSERPSTSG